MSLGEERGVWMIENRVLREKCRLKMDEVTGEWRTLDNGELHDPYYSPDIIRVMKSR